VDKYYSNLCLQIVPNPDAMIQDCYRVLKPGGAASFSVWGRKEISPLMTIFTSVMKKLEISVPETTRSLFHMGNDNEALRKRFLDAGFSSCVIWPQFVVAPPNLEDCLTAITFAPSVQQILNSNEERKQEIYAAIKDAISQRLASGEPIGLECLVIVVHK
jgi:ubiquinone/menaquinone biosynthesis C-methylase UbiE